MRAETAGIDNDQAAEKQGYQSETTYLEQHLPNQLPTTGAVRRTQLELPCPQFQQTIVKVQEIEQGASQQQQAGDDKQLDEPERKRYVAIEVIALVLDRK